jgi:hypothetical protein
MNQRETFAIEGLDVAVEESAAALSYRFTPRGPAYRPGCPVILLLPFVAFPVALLGLVAYAHDTTPNRPEWEQLLTGVFVAQLVAWLVVGLVESAMMLRWSLRGIGTDLRFTHTGVRHGADRVCELEEIRGLRLFVYPTTSAELNKLVSGNEACLSLLIGEDGGTHGLLGGFTEPALRSLADDIHRRLTAFRFEQGIMSALEPLSVVETTEDEAGNLMHTRPVRGSFRMLAGFSFRMLMNRWIGTVWCLAMFAGLFASGRLVAAGLPNAFLVGHGLVGLIHFWLLMGIWGKYDRDENATQEG